MDTDEQLGRPLTSLVNIFIGVAGPNFGAGILCPSVVPESPCDPDTGMCCGSKFLADINRNSL